MPLINVSGKASAGFACFRPRGHYPGQTSVRTRDHDRRKLRRLCVYRTLLLRRSAARRFRRRSLAAVRIRRSGRRRRNGADAVNPCHLSRRRCPCVGIQRRRSRPHSGTPARAALNVLPGAVSILRRRVCHVGLPSGAVRGEAPGPV